MQSVNKKSYLHACSFTLSLPVFDADIQATRYVVNWRRMYIHNNKYYIYKYIPMNVLKYAA